MKKLFLLTPLFLVLQSCDPETSVTYHIRNTTGLQITMYFYGNIKDNNDTLQIDNNSIKTWNTISVSGTSPTKIELDIVYDSILLKREERLFKTYKPNTQDKNIFDYQYWNEKKRKRRDYEYTYTITNDDINLIE